MTEDDAGGVGTTVSSAHVGGELGRGGSEAAEGLSPVRPTDQASDVTETLVVTAATCVDASVETGAGVVSEELWSVDAVLASRSTAAALVAAAETDPRAARSLLTVLDVAIV